MSIFTNRDARVEALREISIFANLPKKDLVQLDRHVTASTVEDGTQLAREGFKPTQLVLLVEGNAKVKRGKRTIATLGPGDTIGELSILDGGKQTATVTADGECDVLVVSANEFRAMLDDSPGFVRNLLKSMAARLRDADELLAG